MKRDAVLFQEDLDLCYSRINESVWQRLQGRRLFITGGTGFIGKWLLETLVNINGRLDLGCQVTVLSRDPASFLSDVPRLAADPAIALVKGDVRNFTFPDGEFDVVIHAATDVTMLSRPEDIFATCIEGTKHVLSFVRQAKVKDFLLVSSGAVYGRQPADLIQIPESFLGGPDQLLASSAYAEGKRASEWLACMAAASTQLKVKVARVFALVGPHLPLDKHFAIGNFLRAALLGRDIVIEGDGTAFRSYLYAADMAAWLWAILLKGQSGVAYNVGSEEGISIKALAERVSAVLNTSLSIKIKTPTQPGFMPQRYVPNCEKARIGLGISSGLSLDESIARTARWYSGSVGAV